MRDRKIDGRTCLCDYDRPVNLPLWVSSGLKACNVVVNGLVKSQRTDKRDGVSGCPMSRG